MHLLGLGLWQIKFVSDLLYKQLEHCLIPVSNCCVVKPIGLVPSPDIVRVSAAVAAVVRAASVLFPVLFPAPVGL